MSKPYEYSQAVTTLTRWLESSWSPLTSDVPQGSTLDPVLFKIIFWIVGRVYLSKTKDYTKFEGVTDAPKGCTAIQRDLDSLENELTRIS